eukprot:CAMPEP_0168184894 /NCGR_PEP_ID=MMETSP0139_2-20121125/13519_1 /TAXON_ID=44445 /ORGANISM="Pseudo-nitzschia australis, Strain 10249 10 AB" /LENGTH=266 /DNA_ID=CAMNT_0008106619 /DNA_START=466 /DNA_END=1263 /DNA_ORIENTATION=-
MPNKTQFAFASSASNFTGVRRKGKGGSRNSHRRNQSEDTDNTDGAGSLTYSATSSVQSGGSAAGESTDSSFADIMRVLDLQDEKQLKEYIKKEGCTTVDELQKKRGWTTSGQSVTSSLAYSTDGESALEGTKLLQTIAGQANDNYGFDGGNTIEDEKLNLLFAPAAPAVVKKTKGNKVVLGKDKTTKRNSTSTHSRSSSNTGSSAYGTPEQKSRRHYSASPSSSTKSTPVKSPPSDPGTPPLPTRKQFTKDGVILVEDDDVWYKEW